MLRNKQRKGLRGISLVARKAMILKWSGERHLEVEIEYVICCKFKNKAQKDSDNSENEKMDLCGQSPLVDTEILTKVKKTADFI